MRCAGSLFGLFVVFSVGAFSQPADAPKFEVAEIRTSPRTNQAIVRGPFFSSGRYELRFATMLDLIRMAYNLDPEKVYGGPNWLEMKRFDVFAKIPASSTAESRRLMLRSLLVDRFKLVLHDDKRPMTAFALTAPGKHSQLKEADSSVPASCKFDVLNAPNGPPTPGTPITLPEILYACKSTSMAELAANMLSIPGAQQYFNNRLVVDQTELTGAWDFSFRFTPKVPAGIQTTGTNISIFDALDKQLGLKLEVSTVPLPVIVVDSVNAEPTENSAEAAKSFPPLPTEFEVASLKPSPPPEPGRQVASRPDIKNGRLYLPGISLKNLISIAWEVNGDEFLIGAPKWLDEDRYDILAKAPSEVAIGDLTPNRNGVPVNIDALRPMLKALIVERFHLVAHTESRPMNAYSLISVKPKLKKADPTSRTRWQEGSVPEAAASKNANSALGRMVTCQNVSMAQFAEMLPGIAPGYIRTDVVDATGLEGGWDFTFSFSPVGALQLRPPSDGNAPAGGGSVEASEPSSAISLFDAIAKQLGLKLEQQKRPAQVLVIESIDRKPIDN